MPDPIALPQCLMECYEYLFPNIVWSRVAFFKGMPDGMGAFRDPDGFTMAAGGPAPDIHVYLKDYDPCSHDTFVLIAHELVHVTQILGMSGRGHIPGSWATYYMTHVMCGGWTSGCGNELEREAYEFADGCKGSSGKLDDCVLFAPCECGSKPWPERRLSGRMSAVDVLKNNCPDLIMAQSRVRKSACTWLTGPVALIGGAFSIFGFRNLGGFIGATIGAVAGAVAGAIIGCIVVGAFLGPFGCGIGLLVGAWLGAMVGALIGGAIGWAINWVVDWVEDWWNGPPSRIWFTAFNGVDWIIPDYPVTNGGNSLTSRRPAAAVMNNALYIVYRASNGSSLWYNYLDGYRWLAEDRKITSSSHTRTSESPALAYYKGYLYMAYKSSENNDLWYNVFDGDSWRTHDIKITSGGHTKTSGGPSLAVLNDVLYMAYRSASNDDIWYNYYDGSDWQQNDIKVSQGRHTLTDTDPALAEYGGKLYLAYRSSSHDGSLWYNVFDGSSWLAQDIEITSGGHTKSSRGPSLLSYGSALYMIYRSTENDDLYYNRFDGSGWLAQDIRISRDGHVLSWWSPALAVFNTMLFMVYRDNS